LHATLLPTRALAAPSVCLFFPFTLYTQTRALAAPSDIFVSFGYIHTYTCADQEQDTPCIPLPCHPDDAALMPSFQHTSSLFELFDLSTPQGGKKKQKEIQKKNLG
jgi:hypothetical protein